MVRKRIESEPRLTSWDEVDQALKEIAERQIQITTITNSMNVAIADIKANAENARKPHADAIARLEADIKEFAEAHRPDIHGRTKKLVFGNLGFRASTKLVVRNIKATLAALAARGMTDCIKIKESIDKAKLETYSDADLAAVGATRKPQDCFWYEVDYETLKTS